MKKLIVVIALAAYGACFGLSAAREAEVDIEINNRSATPVIIAIQGQTPTCKVMGTVAPKGRQSFTVPCAKVASITATMQAEGGTIEKQLTNLGGKTDFTINSNNVWTNQALDRFTITGR